MKIRTHTSARAFTLVELLVSILVIAILLGLLIVGARAAIRFVKIQADRQSAISLRIGATQFKQDMGFHVPLVRDQFPGGLPERARVELIDNSPLRRVAVYDIGAAVGADVYRNMLMKKVGSGTVPPGGWGDVSGQEYYDVRWSNNSLAYYLVGGLEEKMNPADDAANDPTRPSIDGKSGFGLVAANRDGSFRVPLDIANNTATSVALPKTFDPYFVPNNSSTKIYVDPADIKREDVQLRDRNNVPFRYYSWLNDDGFRTDPVINKFLRVPLVVGDPTVDPRLRSARFAIVGAGPDGVFGDETIAVLRAALSMDDASDLQVRRKAVEDNIVEFGE